MAVQETELLSTQTVPAAEFTRHFGYYRMIAQRKPLAISSHGRITGYFIPPQDYEDYLRYRALPRALSIFDLTELQLEDIEKTSMDPCHDSLNALLDEQ
jgi:hypothetical protein